MEGLNYSFTGGSMKKIITETDLSFIKSEQVKHVAESEYKRLLDIFQSPGSPYNPGNDGYILVLDESDTENEIKQYFGVNFQDILWEGVHKVNDCFVGVVMFNNQFGLTVIIPDMPWLNPQWKQEIIKQVTH